ncbi:bifunctional 5,10-methylenetetrahydrofolate dehydrogenase/5,10-methenyltetrahydrofolate cyclohydrolase [Candidatus Uhrbacteria bacterium]|nr:bifunctional 5,10-methylenetetrahydrofolate dehydrogenase/5,10-methenyltetrahydrofolate cyclohydrolase [Candidatus Uhrbacteria bacterium]
MFLIDGKALAERIRAQVAQEIKEKHLSPHLAILLVGDDPASHLYVGLKQKYAAEVGVRVTYEQRSADVSDDELVDLIQRWNQDPSVHAILVQIPLPPGHDEQRIIEAIDPKKDVDGFRPASTSVPPVHEGILRLINETPLKLSGASAAIIVNSDLFAAPLKRLLSTGGMFVNVMHPDDLDQEKLASADVVVIAVGRTNFLHASMTKPDAVIIDVGTNKTDEGKTCGDVDRSSFEKTYVWLTPVPGGVGPMTIAQLLKNVAGLAQQDSSPSGSFALT